MIRRFNIIDSVIIIPSYNPHENFIQFINDLLKIGFRRIIVVNDGSPKEYEYIFDSLKKVGVEVYAHKVNLGKGTAIKTGIKQALLLFGNDIRIITADCDGQHLPEDILKINDKLVENNNQLILGIRTFGNSTPDNSRIGNKISSFIFSCITKIKCSDTQTGLRGIPSNLIEMALQTKGSRYEYETNFLINAAKLNGLSFVPISTIYTQGNKNSHFKKVRDSILITFSFCKNISFSFYYKLYIFLLIAFSCFILLDTFVIPKVYETEIYGQPANGENKGIITNNGYESNDVSVKIKKYVLYKAPIYVADIKIKNSDKIKTALAHDTLGLNIFEKTTDMARKNNAILAINGDGYGFRKRGFAMRNKRFYRQIGKLGEYKHDVLVIDDNGKFSITDENKDSPADLVKNGAKDILSFGPALLNDGKIIDGNYLELDYFKHKQPRTAVCEIEPLHYIFAVTDGRIHNGLTIRELSQVMKDFGCKIAYNLDGGGSSTMVFDGKLINKPSEFSFYIKERKVSDILYIEK